MAKVGDSLKAPEEGWKRFDDTDTNITYEGTWTSGKDNNPYGGSYHKTVNADDSAKFNFVGTKLRILSFLWPNQTTSMLVFIDGVQKADFTEDIGTTKLSQCLVCEITDLSNQEHSVQIINKATGGTHGEGVIDAIDIDDTGEIKPYKPVQPNPTTGNSLLRVNMIDSSEREYKVSQTEIDGFVNWYNHHSSTDAPSYAINDIVDSSKEYLAFEKIISFKVIPLAQ